MAERQEPQGNPAERRRFGGREDDGQGQPEFKVHTRECVVPKSRVSQNRGDLTAKGGELVPRHQSRLRATGRQGQTAPDEPKYPSLLQLLPVGHWRI